MSKHIFTIEVECETPQDYENAMLTLANVGEVTDEESDFE